jgi:flagellar biosynthetic protein FliR
MLNGEFLLMWFLASVRATGVMIVSPVFSSKTVPAMIRLLMSLFVAMLAVWTRKAPGNLPANVGEIVVAMAQEAMIGLLMGWVVRLTMNSVEMASHVISSELGLSMGQQIDPMSDTSESAVGQLLMSFAAMVFFTSGAHQSVLASFLRSFDVAPLAMLRGNLSSPELLVTSTGKIFHIGMQIAAPLIAINFVISFTFSILGKVAPSMNVFGESFAVRIVVGLTLLGITLSLAAQLLLESFGRVPETMLRIIP